jgi:tetratricopeptide (TPR) repeat protein
VDDRSKRFLASAKSLQEAGRHAAALQQYRAAIDIDDDPRAHLGIAKCLVANEQRDAAVQYLVERGREASEDRPQIAYRLLGTAVRLDPSQLELHVELAELELARGDSEAARTRLLELARIYAETDREDEAQWVLDAALATPSEPGAVTRAPRGATERMVLGIPTVQHVPEDRTVIVRTVLRFPDGTIIPGQGQPQTATAPPRDKVNKVHFKPPRAPRLRQPRRALVPAR